MGEFSLPKFSVPNYDFMAVHNAELATALNKDMKEVAYDRSAEHICDIIVKRIKDVQSSLDGEHEVALLLASFGKTVLLSIESIEPVEPSCLVFTGYVDDQKSTLIQHVNQLSILISVAKIETERPAHRFGF